MTYYHVTMGRLLDDVDAVVSRTGYTGEDGWELIVAGRAGRARLGRPCSTPGRDFGIVPCGLGARDTLRFEAAMPLYGHELSESINPFAAGVGWAVKLDKGEFVGREPLRAVRRPTPARPASVSASKASGSPARAAGVLRDGKPIGTVTSGTFAPTLGQSLAMALVEPSAAGARDVASPSTSGARRTRDGRQAAVLPTSVKVGPSHAPNEEDSDMDPKTLSMLRHTNGCA